MRLLQPFSAVFELIHVDGAPKDLDLRHWKRVKACSKRIVVGPADVEGVLHFSGCTADVTSAHWVIVSPSRSRGHFTMPTSRKTFFLDFPKDYYDKFIWEDERYDAMRAGKARDERELAFQLLNCMTTAWHLSDWVFAAMTDEQRAVRCDGQIGKAGFQSWLRKECHALHICRQIAPGNKHYYVTKHNDDAIGTDQIDMDVDGKGDARFQSETWITLNGYSFHPHSVFKEAESFCCALSDELGLFAGAHHVDKAAARD